MKLYFLLKNLNARVLGSTGLEICGLYHKDTEVKEGGLFFCLRGTRVDGRNYVLGAIKNGAVAIVTEQEIPNLPQITQIVVKNSREAMSLLACRFFGNPASKMKIVGVTGTNGKTTTTSMIASVLECASKKVALIGTNGVFIRGTRYCSGMTTPDPIELQQYFALMVKNKIEYVVMEVSAHASDLYKVEGFRFCAMVFTNLTEDHLDYFKSMERYFLAKAKLFSRKYSDFAIINADDSYCGRLLSGINLPYVTYSKSVKADFVASDIIFHGTWQEFTLNHKFNIKLNMAGEFNVSNALGAIAALEYLGIDDELIVKGLSEMRAVSGRFNTYNIFGSIVVIDYAHTPDGIKNVLEACRKMAGEHQLISVFGCGGNREVEKRRVMGEISDRLSDFTIVTSDNPRYEKKEDIARDIVCGIVGKNYAVELDRARAIRLALSMAKPKDVVLIAGKGAEDYIEENGVKIPYSDAEELDKIVRERE